MSGFAAFSTGANSVPVGTGAFSSVGGFQSSPPSNPTSSDVQSSANLGLALRQSPGGFPLDAASKPARKVYVGNLPPIVDSDSLIQDFFNQTLNALLPNKPAGNSILSTYLNNPKRFAFLELRSVEETSFLIGLDGIQFDNYALKLRRPQDYDTNIARLSLEFEMSQRGGVSSLKGALSFMGTPSEVESAKPDASADLVSGALGIISTSVEDGPNKVFVGGLPHNMADSEVKELLSSFGPLKAFHLVTDREQGCSKGFAFCEWRDLNVTDIACQSLNGMKVGERFLNVRRAVPHAIHRAGTGLPAPQLALPLSLGQANGIGTIVASTASSYPLLALDDTDSKMMTTVPSVAPPKVVPVEPLRLFNVTNATCSANAMTDSATENKPQSNVVLRQATNWRCVSFKGFGDKLRTSDIDSLVEHLQERSSTVGRVRSATYHSSGTGTEILLEFATNDEAEAAYQFFNGSTIRDMTVSCAVVDLVPDMKRGCLSRCIRDIQKLQSKGKDSALRACQRELAEISEMKQNRQMLLRDLIVKQAHTAALSSAASSSAA